jgi:PIN domain nuclease of toxin-antitoxin system
MSICKIDSTFSFRVVNETSRVQSFGEVFTPMRFVGDMLNLLDADAWMNPATVIVEPTCGDGAFVVEVLRRRFAGLDRFARQSAVAIAATTLWAIDIQADNVSECRANVLRLALNHLYPQGVTVANIQDDIAYLAALIAAIEHHIKPGDGLTFRPALEESFLACSKGGQRKAAGRIMKRIQTLLNGVMVASWLSKVICPNDLFGLPVTEEFQWTDETVQLLRDLWDQGLSTREIARRLGVTNCAIRGKTYRLGLLKSNPGPMQLDMDLIQMVPSSPITANLQNTI